MGNSRSYLTIVLVIVCFGSICAAEQPIHRCADQPECLTSAQDAMRHERAGQMEQALKLYQDAYVAYGDPRLLVFIGDVLMRLGRFEAAAHAYSGYLQSRVDPLQSKLVQKTQERFLAAEEAISTSSAKRPTESSPSISSEPAMPRLLPPLDGRLPTGDEFARFRVPSIVHEQSGNGINRGVLPGAAEAAVATGKETLPRHPAWRKRLGISLVVVGALALGTALALTALNGSSTDGVCPLPGNLNSQCHARYLPLFAAGYTVSGATFLGSVLAFSLR